MTTATGKPPMEMHGARHKSFTFRTSTTWSAGTSGVVAADGRPSVPISSPAEFRGESQAWSPEELFVASVETCFMSTFLAHAAQRQLSIRAYRSHANGVLEYVDGQYRFTRIVLFPSITVACATAEKELHALLDEAREHCLIANSIASIVETNPTIVLE